MKTLYFNGRLRIAAMMMFLMAMCFTSCEKEYSLELPLSVTQNKLSLGAGGGSTHVLVYSTGDWSVQLKNPADAYWANIVGGEGKGNGEFIFEYTKNPSLSRKTIVIITSGDSKQEIAMEQTGLVTVPELLLLKKAVRMPSWETTSAIGLDTNLELDPMRITTKVEYGDFNPADGADNSKVETTLATEENPGWLTDIILEEDSVRFTILANDEELPRGARLTLTAKNGISGTTYKATTIISQENEAGYVRFVLPDDNAQVESFAKTVLLPWDTNMEMFFEKMTVNVNYEEPGEEWITEPVFTPAGLQVKILESHYDGMRHATVNIAYNGAEGSVAASCKVVQDRPALEIPFGDLRARLDAAGTLTLDRDYILAQVISLPGDANLETNPQPTWNTVDLTESTRTAYVQSMDGKYGFRVKLADGTVPGILPRYATVKISLADLVMEREDAPVRYTLHNVNANSILETTNCTASSLAAKKMYINQITDDDIYTSVTFKDMELAFPYGIWGGMHNGFAVKSDVNPLGNATQTRCDCVPRFFRDKNGSVIPMLINAQCSWRGDTKYVPKGSGTVTGIIVHSLLSRYNVNKELGTYQFRVMSRDDIKLSETNSITTNIATWQWTGGKSTIMTVANAPSQIRANQGTGVMDTDSPLSGTKTDLTTNWMSIGNAAAGTSLAFRYNGPWWDFTNNKGYNVSWNFSTAGITGSDRHLTIVFTASGGKQAQPSPVPVYWNLEYSTDGENFTILKKKFVLYPSPIYAYTIGNIPAGNAEYIFELPDELLDKPSVTVRIKAFNTKYTTSSGLDKGTLTATTANLVNYLRFDGIIIKYNK